MNAGIYRALWVLRPEMGWWLESMSEALRLLSTRPVNECCFLAVTLLSQTVWELPSLGFSLKSQSQTRYAWKQRKVFRGCISPGGICFLRDCFIVCSIILPTHPHLPDTYLHPLAFSHPMSGIYIPSSLTILESKGSCSLPLNNTWHSEDPSSFHAKEPEKGGQNLAIFRQIIFYMINQKNEISRSKDKKWLLDGKAYCRKLESHKRRRNV